MIAAIKQRLKDQKGLTLIELLAVVVILAIIAAIAIPSIGGLIDNTKKDAHVANAQQMVSSAKTYVAGNANDIPEGKTYLPLGFMIKDGLIEEIEDPDDKTKKYIPGADAVSATEPTAGSYVEVTKAGKKYEYAVTLIGNKRKISEKKQSELKRSVVEEVSTAGGGTPADKPAGTT